MRSVAFFFLPHKICLSEGDSMKNELNFVRMCACVSLQLLTYVRQQGTNMMESFLLLTVFLSSLATLDSERGKHIPSFPLRPSYDVIISYCLISCVSFLSSSECLLTYCNAAHTLVKFRKWRWPRSPPVSLSVYKHFLSMHTYTNRTL